MKYKDYYFFTNWKSSTNAYLKFSFAHLKLLWSLSNSSGAAGVRGLIRRTHTEDDGGVTYDSI